MLLTILKKITHFDHLSYDEMTFVMNAILQENLTPAQISAFLIGLDMKGISVDELTAAVNVMRSKSLKISPNVSPLLDIVGTGGDEAHTFNISTTSAFVAAGAGVKVAKHGNRSVSSTSGSADVLEQSGINLNLKPLETEECINKIGIGFLFAPQYHPALKTVAAIRKELGIRTFFNLLGPLTNPANAPYLVIGVYAKKWLPIVAEVLLNLKCQKALVVHSHDGLDEISISAPTDIAELNNNQIHYYEITPEQFGFKIQSINLLKVKTSSESVTVMNNVFHNNQSAALDVVLLNSGAAIYIAGLAESLEEGIEKAKEAIANKKALEKFQELILFTSKNN